MKLFSFILMAMLTISSFADTFRAEELVGQYHLSSSLMKNRYIVLNLNPDASFHVQQVREGQAGPVYSGAWEVGSYYENTDSGPSIEVTTITGTASQDGKKALVVIHLKDLSMRDLQKGAYATLDISMDDKQYNNISIKIHKNQ